MSDSIETIGRDAQVGHARPHKDIIISTCPTPSQTARRLNELGSRAVYLLAQSTDLGMDSWAATGK
jgi:hypothetical protein